MRTLYNIITEYIAPDSRKSRDITLDVLRGIAILCVIFTHLPGVDLRFNFKLWWFYAFFVEMAVPVFMILMGYCAVMAAEKNNVLPLQLYSPANIIRKCRRYFLPWIPVILAEIAVSVLAGTKFTFESLGTLVINGGSGPGSYYIPVLLQFVLIFPLLFMAKKHIIILTLLLNLIYEIAVCYFHIPSGIYRSCILRYLFLIGCGMSMFYNRTVCYSRIIQWSVTAAGVVYLFYMTFFLDFGRDYPHWWGTGALSGLYLYFPLRYIIVNRIFEKIKVRPLWDLFAFFGVRSYHIFLMQMFYYFCVVIVLNNLEISALVRSLIITVFAFPVCIAGGSIYYYLEGLLDKHKKV